MRKTLIILGVLMFCAAAAAFGYRWVIEPKQRLARAPAKVQTEQLERAPSTRGIQAPGAAKPADDGRRDRTAVKSKDSGQAPQGWQLFEMAIDVLNVVVGLAGIWLALMGMRMQREAAMALRSKSES